MRTELNIGNGFGVGSIIAAILSWTTNHDAMWCILHTACGWFYVIYWYIFKW